MAFFRTDSRKDEKMPTLYWRRFQRGKDYIYRKGLIDDTNRNWNFYIGKQWEGVETGGQTLPSEPFIKGVVDYKVNTITQSTLIAKFSDITDEMKDVEVYNILNRKFNEDWERCKMDVRMRDLTKDAAITGDGFHFYGYKDVSKVEQIPCTNVLFGDESEPNVQKQPYIIIWERRSVNDVRKEAVLNGISEEKAMLIVPDDETADLIGNSEELDGTNNVGESKVTCIVHLEKKNGVVNVARSTKTVVYEPEHPIQMTNPDGTSGRGMTLYPIVKFSWLRFPNDARGVSEVKGLIPNQIEINKTLARRSQIIKMTAFPRLAYDANAIQNPDDLMKVGAPIECSSGNAQSVNQMIAYLNPAQSNGDAGNYADDLLAKTQELVGAGETARGNIELNRVAASAVLAIRDQSALPLNEQETMYHQAAEDMAMIWFENMVVYGTEDIQYMREEEDPITGETIQVPSVISLRELAELTPKIRIDISKDNPWTKEAQQTWLDNALASNLIVGLEEYVKLAPPNSIVPISGCYEILADRKRKQEIAEAQTQIQQQMLMEQQLSLIDSESKD